MRRALVAAGLFALALLLVQPGIGRPLANSDEAVYGEMALEMAGGSGVWTLAWQNRPVLNRPPLAVWPLALAARGFGPSERALREPVALESALAVVLLFLLGAEWYGTLAGLCAALLCATADRWLHYGRAIESEPLLVCFVLGAFLCWRRGWAIGFGLCMGGALMTKQVVGAVVLLAPAVDLIERKLDRRRLWMGLGAAALVTLPWFAGEWAVHGRAFVDSFLVQYVVARSLHPLHAHTTPAFYLAMLWSREGPLVLLAALGLLWAAWKRDLLLLGWVLGVLLLYSAAASRADYYLLLAYPGIALAMARLVDASGRLRAIVIPLVVVAWALPHLLAPPEQPMDPESGQLAAIAGRISRPGDPLVLVDQVPYSARFYSQRRTLQLVFDPAEYDAIRAILPAEVELTQDPAASLERLPRWFAIVPRVYLERLRGTVFRVGQTPTYELLTNVPRAER